LLAERGLELEKLVMDLDRQIVKQQREKAEMLEADPNAVGGTTSLVPGTSPSGQLSVPDRPGLRNYAPQGLAPTPMFRTDLGGEQNLQNQADIMAVGNAAVKHHDMMNRYLQEARDAARPEASPRNAMQAGGPIGASYQAALDDAGQAHPPARPASIGLNDRGANPFASAEMSSQSGDFLPPLSVDLDGQVGGGIEDYMALMEQKVGQRGGSPNSGRDPGAVTLPSWINKRRDTVERATARPNASVQALRDGKTDATFDMTPKGGSLVHPRGNPGQAVLELRDGKTDATFNITPKGGSTMHPRGNPSQAVLELRDRNLLHPEEGDVIEDKQGGQWQFINGRWWNPDAPIPA
ncbi:unnamed protein product, partial [Amoebophrya sp. A120]